MPEEIEPPIDEVREHLHHLHEHAESHEHEHDHDHDHGHEPATKDWTRFVALFTAILAAIAVVGSLESGLLINESLLLKNEQIARLTQASDTWNYYQAEGLKSLIYETSSQSLPPNSKTAADDIKQSQHYKDKQTDLHDQAQKLTDDAELANKKSEKYLSKHHVFAISVSLLQIAIALSAVAALTKRRNVWLVGLAAGAIGAILMVFGFVT